MEETEKTGFIKVLPDFLEAIAFLNPAGCSIAHSSVPRYWLAPYLKFEICVWRHKNIKQYEGVAYHSRIKGHDIEKAHGQSKVVIALMTVKPSTSIREMPSSMKK